MVCFYLSVFSIVSKHIKWAFLTSKSFTNYLLLVNLLQDSSYIVVNLSATPQLAVNEVEQVQQERIAGLIGHIFQLTYDNTVDELIQEEKLNRCHGCAIQHPSQRQNSRLMMDKKDSSLYYREDVLEKINLNALPNNVESACSALGFKLHGQSWEMYVSELPRCLGL